MENKLKETGKKWEDAGKKVEEFGKAMQGCGCAIMSIPILIILLWFIWTMLKSLFLQ